MLPKFISPCCKLPALLTFCRSCSDLGCKLLYLCKQQLPWGKPVGLVPRPHRPGSTHPALLCPTVSALWKGVAAPSLPRSHGHLKQAVARGFHSLPKSLLPQKRYGTEKHFTRICPGGLPRRTRAASNRLEEAGWTASRGPPPPHAFLPNALPGAYKLTTLCMKK